MIATVATKAIQQLTFRSTASVVIGYKRKRSIFDMTSYEEEWVPRVQQYHKTRKPKQLAWTDPEVKYPLLIPPIRNMKVSPKQYLR